MRGVTAVLPVKEVGSRGSCENVRRIDPPNSRVRPTVVVLKPAIAYNRLLLLLLNYLIRTHLLSVRCLLLDRLHMQLLTMYNGRLITTAIWLHPTSHQPLVHPLTHTLFILALMLEGRLLLLLECFLTGDLGRAYEVDWRVFLVLLLHEEGASHAHLAVVGGLVSAG